MTLVFPKLAQLKSPAALRARFEALGWPTPCDDHVLTAAAGSPLAQPLRFGALVAGNRWCIHPMEGWDAHPDGSPSDLTLRRWRRFGQSGAKLIWGGEAAAVTPDARANPHQTLAVPENLPGLRLLLQTLLESHASRFPGQRPIVGLQLTHSGRFCRPTLAGPQPRIAYHHPLLDRRAGIAPHDNAPLLRDDELERLEGAFEDAAGLAQDAGFDFVDVKACHGYLVHELLSGRTRSGPYGGDLEGRSRLLRNVIARIASKYPRLMIAVRLSVFDTPPFARCNDHGRMESLEGLLPYRWGFGVDANTPLQMDLSEPLRLIGWLRDLGVVAVSITCGSPYYNPHQQRPAAFPPSDGYPPPEDPLLGVARHIHAARQCKQAFPQLPMVGAGYSYLQEYLPHVGQALVREGWIDSIGLGRMVLSYPELPDDVLHQGRWQRKKVCRTFSDCTTGPRKGLVSGCYPLDEHYRELPQASQLHQLKQQQRAADAADSGG